MNKHDTMKTNNIFRTILLWVDSEAQGANVTDSMKINWLRSIPFIFLHLACLGIIWVGVSWIAVTVCAALFWIRMFAITGFYHRYFSHRSFKTNRFWQFVFAFIGNSSAQRGPLWWAAHHRKHHKHSDQEGDLHSPVRQNFWYSHMGWFISDAAFKTDYSVIKDWANFPELRFLNRYDIFAPAVLAVSTFLLGVLLELYVPDIGTNGWQMLVWGFFVSTVILFHGTFTINSLAHTWGSRRYSTKDHSRNNPWLAFITLGEGWHNNHHRFAVSARQGFYWWEIDPTYYVLKIMSWFGIVRDLNPVPVRILQEGRSK